MAVKMLSGCGSYGSYGSCGCSISHRLGSRCSLIITSSFLIVLLLAVLLVTNHKSDLQLWYAKATTPRESKWPSPEAFWNKLSWNPRGLDHCHFVSSCPGTPKKRTIQFKERGGASCPDYFQWIYRDLAPWRSIAKDGNKPITLNSIEEGQPLANFRVVIKDGRLFVEPYKPCFQTRAIFTIWGLLQLLEYYPGMVPDVDLHFGCGDYPGVLKRDHDGRLPPPVFRYCSTIDHFDIPFPDWSYWGWPELNIPHWDNELSAIVKGSHDEKWENRRPIAFWKGNPDTGNKRHKLLECNRPDIADIVRQDWGAEISSGFVNSKLPDQCKHRYKIYVEGNGWSVSLKYILACDSTPLVVEPQFYDFFSRGIIPRVHYWPVRSDDRMCDSMKFAVDWGNNHTLEAIALGQSGQQYITQDVSMKHVYNYMLHLLVEYSKLLDFSPSPGNAIEVCSDCLLCLSPELEQKFYQDSQVLKHSPSPPCQMSPTDASLDKLIDTQQNITRQIREWEEIQWTKG